MPVKVQTYLQRHFDRPGITMQTFEGTPGEPPHDLETLSGLKPDPYTGALKRGPDWKAAAALPALTNIAGAFFDQANARYCLIGEDADGDTALIYTTTFASWSAIYKVMTSGTLGGLMHRNVLYWGGYLWLIDSTGDIYRGTSYTAALSLFYNGGDAIMLAAMNDRAWAATSSGTILRLTATPDMGAYHTTLGDMNILYMVPYRQYMTVVTKGQDDSLHIFRLPDYAAHGLHQLARIPAPGYQGAAGCPVALHDDEIWIIAGPQQNHNDPYFDVYAFDGNRTRRAAIIQNGAIDEAAEFSGFLVWNNHLLYYTLDQGTTPSNRYFALIGQSFQLYTDIHYIGQVGSIDPFTAALGDYLILYGVDDDEDEVVHYASRRALRDGYLVTPHLDFGHLGQTKRLHSISVLTDDHVTNFKIIIKYRLDDTLAWTTAATSANARLTTTTDQKANFSHLQVRVDVDDDSEDTHQDFAIVALEIKYSVNEYR